MSTTLRPDDLAKPATLRIDGTQSAAFSSKLCAAFIRAGYHVVDHRSGGSVFVSVAASTPAAKPGLALALRAGVVDHAIEARSASTGDVTEGVHRDAKVVLGRAGDPMVPTPAPPTLRDAWPTQTAADLPAFITGRVS